MPHPDDETAVPGSYVIHLALADLLAVIADYRPPTAYLQVAKIQRQSSGITLGEDFVCYITVPIAPSIHALYLLIEGVPSGPTEASQGVLDDAVQGRIKLIEGRLISELSAHGAKCRTGIALVPGLRNDLGHYTGSQTIWRITQSERRNLSSRRIEWL
jgi:hypothetical protein